MGGTIIVSATNCAMFTIALSCNGVDPCVGDCNGDFQVTVANLVTLVDIALGTADRGACSNGIVKDAEINIALLIQAVNNALTGCPGRA